jgi:hypothetical protein
LVLNEIQQWRLPEGFLGSSFLLAEAVMAEDPKDCSMVLDSLIDLMEQLKIGLGHLDILPGVRILKRGHCEEAIYRNSS